MKIYEDLVNELIIDAGNQPDEECLNSSAVSERGYISQKARRIKYTVQFIDQIIQGKNYKNGECKILDIGTTPFTWLYGKYFDARVSSIDRTGLMEKRCRSNNVEFKKCDLLKEDIPFADNEFDLIIFTEVLEHLIGPPQLIFERIRKVLNDNGLLVISTPNMASYYNAIKLLMGKSVLTPANMLFKEEAPGNWVSDGYGHWRKYTMGELRELLSKCQFRVIKDKHIIKPFLDIKTKNPLKLIRRLTWNAIAGILPASQFNLVLAEKK